MNCYKKLSLSILDIDILKLRESLDEFKKLGIKNLHIDIIDTSFTENISIGLSTVNSILSLSEFEFFLHIMVANPIPIIKNLKISPETKIAVHSHFNEFLDLNVGIPVIAINPGEGVESFGDFFSRFHSVLVMTVHPGFGGQKLIKSEIKKIAQLQRLGLEVTVDGGVNENNIYLVKNADYIVIGSAITKSGNKQETLEALFKQL